MLLRLFGKTKQRCHLRVLHCAKLLFRVSDRSRRHIQRVYRVICLRPPIYDSQVTHVTGPEFHGANKACGGRVPDRSRVHFIILTPVACKLTRHASKSSRAENILLSSPFQVKTLGRRHMSSVETCLSMYEYMVTVGFHSFNLWRTIPLRAVVVASF